MEPRGGTGLLKRTIEHCMLTSRLLGIGEILNVLEQFILALVQYHAEQREEIAPLSPS